MKLPIELFEEQVLKNGSHTALVAADRTLTFSELDEEANRIGSALVDLGVRPGDCIMVMMPRNSEFVISLFGVLKAGAGFIPCDPEYPEDRLQYIRENCSAKFIITDRETAGAVTFRALHESGRPEKPEVSGRRPDHTCYMIYTSGTTGRPKGVPVTHLGLANYVLNVPENAYMHSLGKKYFCILSTTTVAFDLYEHDLMGSLLNGITIVFTDEEASKNPFLMAKLIREHHVDIVTCTPSRVAQYLKIPEYRAAAAELKCFWIGGEGFPASLLKELREVTSADVYNGYGPSEITIASHEKLLGDEITVGKTRANYYDRICDEKGNVLPNGEKGELYIGSAAVSPGYWKLDELNAQKFLEIDGVRYFKSGDVAWKDENGEVHIVGRIDNQVKLHGLRIELGEIESLMQEYGAVSQAVVRIKQVRGADHLAAYYTADGEVDVGDLKSFLASRLVPYMVPDYYVSVEKFELSPNGKVNAKVLPEIIPEAVDTVAPRNELEQTVWQACVNEIGSDCFGVTDPLRSAGFSSLSLISIAAFVLEHFHTELKMTDLMDAGCTVETICSWIENGKKLNQGKKETRKTYPALPNLMPLAVASWRNQIFRKITFKTVQDAERLRAAVVRVVNSTPYLNVSFQWEDGTLMQKYNDRVLTEKDIEICPSPLSEEEGNAFFREFMITDEPLYGFKICPGETGCVLLMRMHHALFDHGCMKPFCERILKAYRDPAADVQEEYTFFDRLSELEENKAQLQAQSAGLMKEYTSQVSPAETEYLQHYQIAYQPASLPESTWQKSDLMLAAIGKAVAEMRGQEKLLIYHTYGGRTSAKYFHSMGYFPYMVPMLFDASQNNLPEYVSGEVLRSIRSFSVYDDIIARRMTGENKEFFVSFNYLESREADPDDEYAVEYPHIENLSEDPEVYKSMAHLEFHCFSKGNKGMLTLSYDRDLFTAEEIGALLKKIAGYIEAGI